MAIVITDIPLNMLNGFNFSTLLYAASYEADGGYFWAHHSNGTDEVLWGYGFTSDNTGTITDYALFDSSVKTLVTIAKISVPESWFWDAVLTPSTADDIAIVRTALTGADTVVGSGYSDVLDGFNGDDTIYGRAGDDLMFGDAGNDKMYGDVGNDALYGDAGNDTLDGGSEF